MLKKRKRNYLRNIYKHNQETNAYMIEVSIDQYNDVFNGWDPSPIKRRDIDPDLLDFIEQCSYDIPLKNKIELHLYIPKDKYNEKKERLTKVGLSNNFRFIIHFIKKDSSIKRRKIMLYIVLSFSFLILSYMSQNNYTLDVIGKTLIEGMFIGGWVFLWEAFSLFFFSTEYSKLKMYQRFLDSDIHFHYEE